MFFTCPSQIDFFFLFLFYNKLSFFVYFIPFGLQQSAILKLLKLFSRSNEMWFFATWNFSCLSSVLADLVGTTNRQPLVWTWERNWNFRKTQFLLKQDAFLYFGVLHSMESMLRDPS